MASGTTLPRTAIEWYAFAALLVVLNVGYLLVTGHTLPAAVAMGLFYGLAVALLVVVVVLGWRSFRGEDVAD